MVHLVRITDALHMPRSAARPEAPQRTPRKGWLPQGRALSDVEFSWRHRIVCGLLAAHIPAIAVITVLRHYGPLHALVEITPVAVLLAAALAPISRRAQALAASLGLVTCSALLVHL